MAHIKEIKDIQRALRALGTLLAFTECMQMKASGF